MKNKVFKRKFLATLILSLVSAPLLIIHGMFLDLDFAQIKRLTLEGSFITFICVFIMLLVLEWIFDIEDHEEIVKLKKRVSKLEK